MADTVDIHKGLHVALLILGSLLSRWIHINASNIDAAIGNVTIHVGETLTLECDLHDIGGSNIVWRHVDRLYTLSYQEHFYPGIPADVINRMDVACNAPEESCSLTISNVTFEDIGTYVCGYQNFNTGLLMYVVEGYLNVIPVPLPPSENSPFCSFLRSGSNTLSDLLIIGDNIVLSCSVNGTNMNPTLVWQRDQKNITDAQTSLTLYTKPFALSEADQGVEYTCIMKHPLVAESRTCFLVPLPSPLTLPNDIPTTFSDEIPTVYDRTIGLSGYVTQSASILTIPQGPPLQAYMLPIIIGSSAFVLLLICIVCLCIVRQNVKAKSKQQIDENRIEETANADFGLTTSILDGSQPNMRNNDSTEEALHKEESSASGGDANSNGTCPVYAKPHKDKKIMSKIDKEPAEEEYINLFELSSSDVKTEEGGLQNDLMYAELELLSNKHAQCEGLPLKNRDATLYADIKGVL